MTLMAATLFFASVSTNAFADAGHAGTAKAHCNAMVEAGESGLDHGGQGHTDTAVKHLKQMVKDAQECLNHGQEAVKTAGRRQPHPDARRRSDEACEGSGHPGERGGRTWPGGPQRRHDETWQGCADACERRKQTCAGDEIALR